MTERHFQATGEGDLSQSESSNEFHDLLLPCIDCAGNFVWTAGEQAFFRDKQLQNPPKRCKDCKKAKTRRLEAVESARLAGKKHRFEIRADCAHCKSATTIPFYPCQGRPVYCRACFLKLNASTARVIH